MADAARLAKLQELQALRAEKRSLLAKVEQSRWIGYRDRPVEFIQERLGDVLWSKQQEIAHSLITRRRTVVSSAFDTGKTFLAGRLVAWWISTDPHAIAVTTATVGRQVGTQVWGSIRQAWRNGIILPDGLGKAPLPGTMDQTLRGKLPGDILPKAPEWVITPGDNFAIGFSTNNPNAFAGWHGGRVLVVLDEAEGIPQSIWEIMEGQLASADVAVLAMGNPDPNGLMSGFQAAAASGIWDHITISAFDTPNLVAGRDDVAPHLITNRFVQERRAAWGEDHPMWITKILGQFVQGSGAKLVIPLSWFERAKNRPGVWDTSEEPVAGLDVARFGSADSVIAIRRGPMVIRLERRHGADGVDVAGWAVETMRAHGCSVVNGDATGLGGPVLDIMRRTPGIRVHDIHAGAKPREDVRAEVARKRDELWWGLRSRFENDAIVIPTALVPEREIDRLKAEVTQITYRYLVDSRIEVESKESMAKRGLPSPDAGDALCLAFVHRPPARSNASLLLGE